MTAPKNFGPDMPSQASIDAKMAKIVRNRGLSQGSNINGNTLEKVQPESQSKFDVEKQSQQENESNRLPWIIAGVLLIGIIFLLQP